MTSLGELWRWASSELAAAGIEQPQRDARLLIEMATGFDAAQVIAYPERELEEGQRLATVALIERRKRREPVSRILGRREFWSLQFKVSKDTLDPRPDSETLIEAVLERIPDRQAAISLLDFGTGTGCLVLALLSELPHAQGIGVDVSSGALVTARENAADLGLSQRVAFKRGHWGLGLDGAFDVIVSNPPYIEAAVVATLEPEVARHDPRLALDGGTDGLDAYRALAMDARRLLRRGGFMALEIGAGQGDSVRKIMVCSDLSNAGSRRDLGGVERCLLFEKV